ncbi:MAG: hypothetical protein IT212_07315 [Bacteroidia bacterium]|nr:hypothetical protein [Bacteroidia bacterium]
MIYTNDESDKSIRQRNFYLTVYIFPIALVAIICGLVYWGSLNNYLQKIDTNYGYFMSLTPAFFLYAFNRRNWLKMPDGTFHYIKGITPTPKLTFNEPTEYEAEYFYSKTEKATSLLVGLGLVGASIWLGLKGSKTILVPIVTNIGGLFMSYVGLKGLLDKSAKLKIAKNGLWTNKLGFVNWYDINFAEVLEDKSGRQPQLFLHIRLKGTKFEEANKPDERLLLSDLKDKDMIETVINSSIINYNNQKKQSSS